MRPTPAPFGRVGPARAPQGGVRRATGEQRAGICFTVFQTFHSPRRGLSRAGAVIGCCVESFQAYGVAACGLPEF